MKQEVFVTSLYLGAGFSHQADRQWYPTVTTAVILFPKPLPVSMVTCFLSSIKPNSQLEFPKNWSKMS